MIAVVTIGVFGLFHPGELEVQAARGNVLAVVADGRKQMLEAHDAVRVRSAATVTGRDGAEGWFVLSVPGKIRREFLGTLEVRAQGKELLAIVTMDRETAVASIVAAEGPPGASLEARKAQAVVARSFLAAAHGRHEGFDFCDTTHCQFLREPPPAASPARRASEETRGLALTYQGLVIAALYSADCGGHTRSLEEAGWQTENYPYFAVECPVRGRVSGHRIGLCQVGAAEMARRGATFGEILAHYFPAALVEGLSK
jgi:peptidoglycan hydrolase-like amidase